MDPHYGLPLLGSWSGVLGNEPQIGELLGRFATLASDLGVPAHKQQEARSVLLSTFQSVLELALAKASQPAPAAGCAAPLALAGAPGPSSVEAVVHDFAKSITRVRVAFEDEEAFEAQLEQPWPYARSPRALLASHSSEDSDAGSPRTALSSHASEDPAWPADEDPTSPAHAHAWSPKSCDGQPRARSPKADEPCVRAPHLPWLAVEDYLLLACERRWVDSFGRRSRAYGCSKWRFVALVLHATLNRLKMVPESYTALTRTERSLRSRCGHLVAQDVGAAAQHRGAFQIDETVLESLQSCWFAALRKMIKM